MRHRYAILLVAITLTACSTLNGVFSPSHFVSIRQVPPTSIDAPPTKDSPAYNAGLRQVIAEQANVTKKDIAEIKALTPIKPEAMVQPTLGRTHTAKCYPALYTLMNDAFSDTITISNNAEDYWGTTRPFSANKNVHRYAPYLDRPGYPSGHASSNTVWADILSEIYPAKRQQFLARVDTITNYRIMGGAHFPYDVSAGKDLGAIIYEKMKQSPAYQQELSSARAEAKVPHHHCI